MDVELAAVGWGTVELERGEHELAPRRFVHAADEELLGAVASVSRDRDPPIVLLAPRTEGRLAAALARMGEGPVAIYVSLGQEPLDRALAELQHRGLRTRRGMGPFGAIALVLGRRSTLTGGPREPDVLVVGNGWRHGPDERVPSRQ